jgi:hypothetical protein
VGTKGRGAPAFQRAFEQRSEDGGFDFGPVGAAGFEQQVDLVAGERQDFGLFEQLAVEARQLGADGDGELAFVHRLPEFGDEGDELFRRLVQGLEQAGEGAFVVDLGQEADVFGKHREQAAREEGGDAFGRVLAPQGLSDAGELCAMSRVARALRRAGSRLCGSCQTAWRRARMSGRARSSSRMRWLRGSGKGV